MKKLLIATSNPGKRREFAQLFEGLPFALVFLDEVFGQVEEVEEGGRSMEENARLKALEYARRSGMLTLADDSGLEVDALGGEPGVHSKRYAGKAKSDEERNRYLLEQLRDVPPGQRTARFRCVIAIAEPTGKVWTTEGTVEGEIAFDLRGTNGFGYDPVFIVSERGMRMAELSDVEKNRISHRARAAAEARRILMDLFGRQSGE